MKSFFADQERGLSPSNYKVEDLSGDLSGNLSGHLNETVPVHHPLQYQQFSSPGFYSHSSTSSIKSHFVLSKIFFLYFMYPREHLHQLSLIFLFVVKWITWSYRKLLAIWTIKRTNLKQLLSINIIFIHRCKPRRQKSIITIVMCLKNQ